MINKAGLMLHSPLERLEIDDFGTEPAVAVAEIDLSLRFPQDWIGDWNDTYRRQQRSSAYQSGVRR